MSHNTEFGPSTRREGNKLKHKEIERKLYKKQKSQRKEQERRERPSSCRLGKTEKKALHRLEKVLEYENISVSLDSEPEPEPEPELAIDEIESSRVIRRQLKRPRRKVSLHVLKNNISDNSKIGLEEDHDQEEEEDYWANYNYYKCCKEKYDRKVRDEENMVAKIEHDRVQAELYRLCFMKRY